MSQKGRPNGREETRPLLDLGEDLEDRDGARQDYINSGEPSSLGPALGIQPSTSKAGQDDLFGLPPYDATIVDYTSNNPAVEEPPPDFAPYEAEYTTDSNGNIVSHDKHLNEDGEALYRFLLSQSPAPPVLRIACEGTHTEHRTRQVTRDGRTTTEHYSETITDFSFAIDVEPALPPVHWTVADHEPAYRGLMVQEVEGPHGKQRVARSERKRHDAWVEERWLRGIPPWILEPAFDSGDLESAGTLLSSHIVRDWADKYCASPKYLKEFVFVKTLYGWNIQQLEDAIRSYIGTFYHDTVSVEIRTLRNKIYIRPDNRLSRTLSNKWLKFLSIVLLIFPFIWLFKRFHKRGGGRWKVAGAAFAMKRWDSVTSDTTPSELKKDAPPSFESSETPGASTSLGPTYSSAAGPSAAIQTPMGPRKVVGIREGEWFRLWQSTIAQCVTRRYICASRPMTSPLQERPTAPLAATQLDGY
ncbi:hypothetical protein EV122DRAFT_260562 [Schizophyllum commune]